MRENDWERERERERERENEKERRESMWEREGVYLVGENTTQYTVSVHSRAKICRISLKSSNWIPPASFPETPRSEASGDKHTELKKLGSVAVWTKMSRLGSSSRLVLLRLSGAVVVIGLSPGAGYCSQMHTLPSHPQDMYRCELAPDTLHRTCETQRTGVPPSEARWSAWWRERRQSPVWFHIRTEPSRWPETTRWSSHVKDTERGGFVLKSEHKSNKCGVVFYRITLNNHPFFSF